MRALAGVIHRPGLGGQVLDGLRYLATAAAAQGDRALGLRPLTLLQREIEIEREQTAFSENAMRYEASLRFLDSKVQGLLRAIKGTG